MFELIDNIYLKSNEIKQSHWNKLSYTKNVWLSTPFGKKPKEKTLSFYDKRSGKCLAGFASRLGVKLPKLRPDNTPFLEGVTFRDYQRTLILTAIRKGRGVILSPTASGKTLIASGIFSCFKSATGFCVVPNVDLLHQTAEELEKHWPGQVVKLGDGINELDNPHRFLVAIIKSAAINIDKLKTYDITIVDECHNCSSIQKKKKQNTEKKDYGYYAKLMINNRSLMKIGLTATLPESTEAQLALEGLIGQVVGEYKAKEGIKKGYLARPIIKLIPVNKVIIAKNKTYPEVRQLAIINNQERNAEIISLAIKELKNKKSSLIICKEIEHGENLYNLFALNSYEDKVFFAQGKTPGRQRLEIKQALESKKTPIVISTIWKEGVNIKSLDAVFIAAGGKSSIQIIQYIGRGLRVTENKKTVTIYDFIDSTKNTAEHFAERIKIYTLKGWLK